MGSNPAAPTIELTAKLERKMSAILPIVIFIVAIIGLNIFQFGRPD